MTKASTAAPIAKVIYIYTATGVRLRDLPLTPERVLEGLGGSVGAVLEPPLL